MTNVRKCVRNPFYADEMEVTTDNMQEVAKWCKGRVRESMKLEGGTPEFYIKVNVANPRSPRQTMAFPGDHVLYHQKTGYKVYTPNAFQKSFSFVEEPEPIGIIPDEDPLDVALRELEEHDGD